MYAYANTFIFSPLLHTALHVRMCVCMCVVVVVVVVVFLVVRQTDRQTDRHTERQTDRQLHIPSSLSPLAHPNSSNKAVIRGSERLAGRLGKR